MPVTIVRVLVPYHNEEGFREKFKNAIRRTEWVSNEGKYVEFILENYTEEDIENLIGYNLFWKKEEGLKNFYY